MLNFISISRGNFLQFASTYDRPRFFCGVSVAHHFIFLCCIAFVLFCLSSPCVLCVQCWLSLGCSLLISLSVFSNVCLEDICIGILWYHQGQVYTFLTCDVYLFLPLLFWLCELMYLYLKIETKLEQDKNCTTFIDLNISIRVGFVLGEQLITCHSSNMWLCCWHLQSLWTNNA